MLYRHRQTKTKRWNRSRVFWLLPVALLILGGILALHAQQSLKKELPSAVTLKVDYQRDIQPIFSSRCLQCHGAQMQMSSLRLDNRRDALAGGNTAR
jgi:mono/diheme cytochrome c family protein